MRLWIDMTLKLFCHLNFCKVYPMFVYLIFFIISMIPEGEKL